MGGAGAHTSAGAAARTSQGVAGALSASGAAGAGGAAGGGWLLAGGPLGAKLAVGCLLALGVGAGCIELAAAPENAHEHVRRHEPVRSARRSLTAGVPIGQLASSGGSAESVRSVGAASGAPQRSPLTLTAAARALREFGPEQPGSASGVSRATASSARKATFARSDPSGSEAHSGIESATAGLPALAGHSSAEAGAHMATRSEGRSSASGASAAEREFAPG
jgi:hypothetical protein